MGSSLLDGVLKRKKDSEKASFYVNKQQYILSFRLCQGVESWYNGYMLALALFEWWYGPGWFRAWNSLGGRLKRTYYGFSVPQLSRTLFSPWRRIVSLGGGSIGDRLRAMVDNFVSRCVGLIVRLLTLAVAGVIIIWWILVAVAQLILWPLAPIVAVILIVKGIL